MDLSYIFIKMKKKKCHFWDLLPTFINPQTNLKNTHFLLLVCSTLIVLKTQNNSMKNLSYILRDKPTKNKKKKNDAFGNRFQLL